MAMIGFFEGTFVSQFTSKPLMGLKKGKNHDVYSKNVLRAPMR